jgi:hypothetical protein
MKYSPDRMLSQKKGEQGRKIKGQSLLVYLREKDEKVQT